MCLGDGMFLTHGVCFDGRATLRRHVQPFRGHASQAHSPAVLGHAHVSAEAKKLTRQRLLWEYLREGIFSTDGVCVVWSSYADVPQLRDVLGLTLNVPLTTILDKATNVLLRLGDYRSVCSATIFFKERPTVHHLVPIKLLSSAAIATDDMRVNGLVFSIKDALRMDP